MNSLLRNTISTEGKDKALQIAKALLEADYQVFIQQDDCDIYIVSYEHNNREFGDNTFASITPEEEEEIINNRENKGE